MSLQDLIVKHDAQRLDYTRRHSFQRHVQKLTKAAQIFIAKNALQCDRIRFLLKMNDESKARRSTKSFVLGRSEGKVMSYDDLVKARAKRAEKDAAKAKRKGVKRGRKRENAELHIDPTKVPRITEFVEPANASQGESTALAAEDLAEQEPQSVPVARMW